MESKPEETEVLTKTIDPNSKIKVEDSVFIINVYVAGIKLLNSGASEEAKKDAEKAKDLLHDLIRALKEITEPIKEDA